MFLLVKDAMSLYFNKRRKLANAGLDFLFKTPTVSDNLDSVIYKGVPDEDDYITRTPVEMSSSLVVLSYVIRESMLLLDFSIMKIQLTPS